MASLVDGGGDGEVYAVAAAIPITLTLACDKGDPLGYSTGWKPALGDATGVIHGRLVALEAGDALDVIQAAPAAVVGGDRFTTAPTAGLPIYVKDAATPGLYTDVMPDTSSGDVQTIIGYALDTENLLIRFVETDTVK